MTAHNVGNMHYHRMIFHHYCLKGNEENFICNLLEKDLGTSTAKQNGILKTMPLPRY